MKKLILIMIVTLLAVNPIPAQSTQPVDSALNNKIEVIEQQVGEIQKSIQDLNRKIKSVQKDKKSSFRIPGGEDTIVDILAIVLIFGMPIFIVLIVYYSKYKNKKAKYDLLKVALQAGKDIPEGLYDSNPKKTNMMTRGISNIAIGLGVGIFLWALTDKFGLGCIGFIITIIGIGQVVIHIVTNPQENTKFSRQNKYRNDTQIIDIIEDNDKNIVE